MLSAPLDTCSLAAALAEYPGLPVFHQSDHGQTPYRVWKSDVRQVWVVTETIGSNDLEYADDQEDLVEAGWELTKLTAAVMIY